MNERVNVQRLRRWAEVAVDEDNRDFGDMSRGALMLKAARAADELAYVPVEQSVRRGRRR